MLKNGIPNGEINNMWLQSKSCHTNPIITVRKRDYVNIFGDQKNYIFKII